MVMSLKEALAAVLKDMEALSAEELRAELDAHRTGAFATAMREAREFLASRVICRSYHVVSSRFAMGLQDDLSVDVSTRAVLTLDCIAEANNDNSYALAA